MEAVRQSSTQTDRHTGSETDKRSAQTDRQFRKQLINYRSVSSTYQTISQRDRDRQTNSQSGNFINAWCECFYILGTVTKAVNANVLGLIETAKLRRMICRWPIRPIISWMTSVSLCILNWLWDCISGGSLNRSTPGKALAPAWSLIITDVK